MLNDNFRRWFTLSICFLACVAFPIHLLAEGPVTFGENHYDDIGIDPDDTDDNDAVDFWTFEAEAGDGVVIIVSEQVPEGESETFFRPNINLFDPEGELVEFTNGSIGAHLDLNLSLTGEYTIRVNDLPDVRSAYYALRVAKAPGTNITPDGDEGGLLQNGINQMAYLDVGDIDSWEIEATEGDAFSLSIARNSPYGEGFAPTIFLHAPDGSFLYSFNTAGNSPATETHQVAEMSGTYYAFVADFNGADAGEYILRLAQTPKDFVIPEGDDGGPLTNGLNHTGQIETGDLDIWTFEAVAGQKVFVTIAEDAATANELSDFRPMVRVLDPDGQSVYAIGTPVSLTADLNVEKTGTYTIIVSDDTEHNAGPYVLRIAQYPDSFEVPEGDEGGPLDNGLSHFGSLPYGDIDIWTTLAEEGDQIVVSIAETNNPLTEFRPRVRIIDPEGNEKRDEANTVAGEVSFRAEMRGTHYIMVDDSDADNEGAPGTYELRLTQFPHPIEIGFEDEGGLLQNGEVRNGQITRGDLDLFRFNLPHTSRFLITLSETIGTGQEDSPFRPDLRFYRSDGTLLNPLVDDAIIEFERSNFDPGSYFLLVSDGNEEGSGPYSLSLLSYPVAIEATAVHSIFGSTETIVDITAVDPDDPAKQTSFSIENAPSGMALNTTSASTAQIKWTPSEEQVPGTYTVTLSATNTYEDTEYTATKELLFLVRELVIEQDITSFSLESPSAVKLQINGDVESTYRLERSIDLVNWEMVQTFQGTLDFDLLLEDAKTNQRVFFRAVLEQP